MNILIACHAGEGIGLGHLSRAMVIAQELVQVFGATVQLLVQGSAVQRDDLDVFEHTFIAPEADLVGHIATISQRIPPDLVVFDLHPARVPSELATLMQQLRGKGCRLVAIDGLGEFRTELDLIFLPSFRAPEGGGSGTAPIVYGWDCYLLKLDAAPVDWEPGHQVLALTGGSDATGLGRSWPTQLDQCLPQHSVLHWVRGPYAQAPIWPSPTRLKVQEHIAPQRMGELMRASNYAVTVFGVSFFELLTYGIPTVVFSPYGKKDAAELAAIAELQIAVVANDELHAAQALRALIQDETMANALSERARFQMKAPGAQRLCAELRALWHY